MTPPDPAAEWPRELDGQTVWACCVSRTGPTCEHQAGLSDRYQIARQVAETHQFLPGPAFEGLALDATTAGAITAVYEALAPRNRARFDAIPLDQLIPFVWKHVTVGARS